MARSMHPDSAGSQFFIMHEAAPHLDGAYAAFGKVIEGQEHVNKIAETATDYSDRPLETHLEKTIRLRKLYREQNRRPQAGRSLPSCGNLFYY